jgi:hypothetical protein
LWFKIQISLPYLSIAVDIITCSAALCRLTFFTIIALSISLSICIYIFILTFQPTARQRLILATHENATIGRLKLSSGPVNKLRQQYRLFYVGSVQNSSKRDEFEAGSSRRISTVGRRQPREATSRRSIRSLAVKT